MYIQCQTISALELQNNGLDEAELIHVVHFSLNRYRSYNKNRLLPYITYLSSGENKSFQKKFQYALVLTLIPRRVSHFITSFPLSVIETDR